MPAVQEKIPLPFGRSFRLLRWTHNLREVDLVLGPEQRARITGEGDHWHFHEALELTYFESGEGTRFVGDKIQRFQAGEVVVLGENLPHYWLAHGPCSGWSVQWHLPPTHQVWAFAEAEPLAAFFKDSCRGIQLTGLTAARLARMLPQLADTAGLDRLGLLMRLFAVAIAAPPADSAFISNSSFSLSVESRHRTSMQVAIRYLLGNFRREIYLSEVLKAARMSKPTFARQFKRHAGKTMNQFLQQIRMDAVCRELSETDRPVTEIALDCGFTQISFFNRAFRRAFRCSPLDYRQACRRQAARPQATLRNAV